MTEEAIRYMKYDIKKLEEIVGRIEKDIETLKSIPISGFVPRCLKCDQNLDHDEDFECPKLDCPINMCMGLREKMKCEK